MEAGISDMAKRAENLPMSLAPRGLNRTEAAAYVGVSATLFDQLVKDKRMPPPLKVNSRSIWDRFRIDQAFNELPAAEIADTNPWDE